MSNDSVGERARHDGYHGSLQRAWGTLEIEDVFLVHLHEEIQGALGKSLPRVRTKPAELTMAHMHGTLQGI